MRRFLLLAAPAILALPFAASTRADDKSKDDGFVSIFDGKTLTGWKVRAKTGHSGASKHKTRREMGR